MPGQAGGDAVLLVTTGAGCLCQGDRGVLVPRTNAISVTEMITSLQRADEAAGAAQAHHNSQTAKQPSEQKKTALATPVATLAATDISRTPSYSDQHVLAVPRALWLRNVHHRAEQGSSWTVSNG